MPRLMPSLIKYFTIVGGLLFAGLIGMNAVMEPGGPGPRLVKNTPKVVVQIDPQASKVERLRAEEAALKAAERANPEAHPVIVTEPLPVPANVRFRFRASVNVVCAVLPELNPLAPTMNFMFKS